MAAQYVFSIGQTEQQTRLSGHSFGQRFGPLRRCLVQALMETVPSLQPQTLCCRILQAKVSPGTDMPICQQNVVSHRLRSRKNSHSCSFFDAQKAFPSQSTTTISGALDSVARLEDRQLREQRYREALVRVSDGRAEADFRPRSGTMQGGGPSAELSFACCVHVCRVKKCFDRSKMKICIAASESVKPVLQVFEGHDSHVRNQGGKTLHGQAPKGGLERDAPTFLDQLSDMLK